MSLQSIRSLNLLAMLAAGYIGLTSSVHVETHVETQTII